MSTRNTCFTLNNYTDVEVGEISAWDCKYLIVGYEGKGEGKTAHIQGYVEWGRPVRFSTLKRLNNRIHWENRKGSARQASEYCKKEGAFAELGEISKQGRRSDIEASTDAILLGCNMREVALADPVVYVKYNRGLEKFKYVVMEDRKDAPEVLWRWGSAGVGKTRWCVETYEDYYIKDGTQWWDGYEQQHCIVIDDFDGHWPLRDLLRLLDIYKYQGQTKGGYVKIKSPVICITCEYPPEHFWEHNELAQLKRRISCVTHVTEVGVILDPTLKEEDIEIFDI